PEVKIPGKVDKLSFESVVVNNVTVYEVDVAPESVPEFMRAGMSAEVGFRVDFKENVLLIPATALRREGQVRFVNVPDPLAPGEFLEQEVAVGLRDGKHVEVVEGLREGETILLPQYRRNAAPVESSGGNPLSPG